MDAKVAARRWFHPTPAWLVYGALAATAILAAVERVPLRWFGFYYYKGWPVLLAVAVVGAVLILLPAWILLVLAFRRPVQFGLRTLLVFVTLCAVVCSWLAVRIKQARGQAELIERIHKTDGVIVGYTLGLQIPDNQPPHAPEPLTKLLGVDFFGDVTDLTCRDDMKRDPQWNPMDPCFPQYTDAGLADVAALTQLEALWIGGDQVTDVGLSHLEKLPNLQHLSLSHTKVTAKGLEKFHHARPECSISVWPVHLDDRHLRVYP